MGSPLFQPPPNNEPSIPAGSDAFDVPVPNFRLIGQMIAAGMQDAKAAGTVVGLGQFISHPLDTLLTWIATVLAWILSKLLCIVAFFMQIITAVDDGAAPGMAAVINQSLAHVFDIPVPGTGPRKVAAETDATNIGANIGNTIINAITSSVGQTTGGTIGPTTQPASAFMGRLAKLGVEGWIEGFVAEVIGGEHLESVLELTPIMAQILGLGRLSRRVMQVPLKVFVTDPNLWALNLQYRPTQLKESEIIRGVLRGAIPLSQMDDMLGRLGHSPTNISELMNINSLHVSLGDVDYLVSHNHWSLAQGVQELKNQGYDEQTANNVIQLAGQKRIDVHDQRLLDATVAAYIRGDVDQEVLHAAVTGSNMPADEQAVFEAVVITERTLHPRHMSLGEVERAVRLHIMTPDDLQTWLVRNNYDPTDATFIELMLLHDIMTADQAAAAKAARLQAAAAAKTAKTAAAQAKLEAAAAKAAYKGVTQADMETLVKEHKKTFDDYAAYLAAQGLPQASIDTLVELLHEKISISENTTVQANGLEAEATAKQIPLATIAASVVAGALTIDDLRSFMQQHNYADQDITIELASVQAKIDKAQSAAAAKATAAGAPAAKAISLPDLERAARLGLTTPDVYAAALHTAGYDATSVSLLVGLLTDQIASDKAALDKRTAAAAKATAKGISLPQLEQAVIDGIQPMTSYTAELASLGFSAADVQTLAALLQLRVDNAKAVAAKKASAKTALAAQGLTLADLERAVRLGVLSIPQFSADLTAAGMSTEDVQLLAASETVAQQREAIAAAKAAAASTALRARGISLSQEQALVKAGISTLDAYTAFLQNAGYSAQDAADLTALLGDQVEQAKAAAVIHAAAAAKSADHDITLAAEEKAVIAGIRSLADYESYLADLGFDATDTATLVALLEAKMGIAGTPAAAGAAPSTPAVPGA